MSSRRTNWHKGIVSAIQIDLRDYSHILEYKPEYLLNTNKNRIDLLIIKKLTNELIPKSIAQIFKSINLFEFKGLRSTVTQDAYYKLNGHAGYYINSTGTTNQYNRNDISLSLFSFHRPRKLFKHLTQDCNKTIEKIYPGIYYISKEMYSTQIIVGKELSPDDLLYLACLTSDTINQTTFKYLEQDYYLHSDNQLYIDYLDQLTNPHNKKGALLMVSEGLLNLYGTSSKEIEEKTKAIYLPQLQQLTEENAKLKQLLLQHGIAY